MKLVHIYLIITWNLFYCTIFHCALPSYSCDSNNVHLPHLLLGFLQMISLAYINFQISKEFEKLYLPLP